jgi:hypothetical protein
VGVSGEGAILMIHDQRHPLYTKYDRKALMFYEFVLAISIRYFMSHLLSIQTEAVVLNVPVTFCVDLRATS